MNPIAKMALGQLIKFMKEKDISELRVFIDTNGEIDFEPATQPDAFIKKSVLTQKVEQYENKILEMKDYLKQLQS